MPQPRQNEPDIKARQLVCLRFLCALMLAVASVSLAGCKISTVDDARRLAKIASFGLPTDYEVERVERPKKLNFVSRMFKSKPEPSERTRQLLHSFNLSTRYQNEPDVVIRWMVDGCKQSPTMNKVHALAELALLEGNWQERLGEPNRAVEMFALAMTHGYQFLFDRSLDISRNAYDPQFRNICDIYNESLANLLRLVCDHNEFVPGMIHTLGEDEWQFELSVEIHGRWKAEEFERLELANDFEVSGIENRYQTFGLGVPMIAVRKNQTSEGAVEQYYPPGLSLPMTAFCDVELDRTAAVPGQAARPRRAVLKLFDPLEQTWVSIRDRKIPLESDITTPIGYQLNDPLLKTGVLSTASMINAQLAEHLYGLYLLEPYDPDKIPVVMVHGIWSSPTTWTEMFNDLRADRQLRDNYQFWFYSYSTGQPFWNSARRLRDDLEQARQNLDPGQESTAWNEMVLVGHSMGGLISRMQTVASEDAFWQVVSDEPFNELEGDTNAIEQLKEVFFFDYDSSVQRVITIGTPHHGSNLANMATKWIGEKLFTLPSVFTSDFRRLVDKNKKMIKRPQLVTMQTSIDSLSPDSPIFEFLGAAERSPNVAYHNIIGNKKQTNLLTRHGFTNMGPGDGVVSVESARLSGVESEIEVSADHGSVHQHPQTILEVRRILINHLLANERISENPLSVLPAGYQQSSGDGEFEPAVIQPAIAEPELSPRTGDFVPQR